MIILDTNVVSELMRSSPAPQVAECIRGLPDREIVTTCITNAEILYGIRRLRAGRRRTELEQSFETLMAKGFRNRLLSFDETAADAYSIIMADRSRVGRPIDIFDAMIAGIALSRSAGVATRNVAHFTGCGIRVIDPWGSAGSET